MFHVFLCISLYFSYSTEFAVGDCLFYDSPHFTQHYANVSERKMAWMRKCFIHSSLTRLVFDWEVDVDCSCGQTAVCSMTCFPQSILHFTECTACRNVALFSVKAFNPQTLMSANAQNAPWSIFVVRQRPFDPRKPQSSSPNWVEQIEAKCARAIKSRRSEEFLQHLSKASCLRILSVFWANYGI